MKRGSHRPERLADQLRAELGRIISQMADPRIGMATVTEVHLSPDLRHARVHVAIHGDDAVQKRGVGALEAARNYLRHKLAETAAVRFTPELLFVLDRGFDAVTRVEELLRRAKKT